jgi:murein DD-endopeptidase MepM/ murein hydrolase activator NlpD
MRCRSTALAFAGLALLVGWAAAPTLGHAEPKLDVAPKAPRPGDPVLVTVSGVDKTPKGTGGKTPLVFFAVRNGWQAIFAVPIDDTATELKIALSEPALSQTVTLAERKWAEEQVTIAPEMAEPPADKRKIIDTDNAAIIAGFKGHRPPLFHGAFAVPGSGARTSTFGAWRTLNGGYRSRHLGVDYAARKGAAVKSVQDGEVTVVRDGFLTGGTVVVVHGAGIASTYFHLDDIKVAVGDTIKRGALIGKVGLTGRTTGPHLHVGIWVPGGFIDSEVFLRLRIGVPVEPAAKDPAAK